MAQTKLFAPDGFHFMVSKKKGFYIMKDPTTGYVKHRLKNGEISSKFVLVDVPSTHDDVRDSFYYNNITKTQDYIPKPVKTTTIISTPKAVKATTKVIRTVRISGGGSGGSSGGSGGGGY